MQMDAFSFERERTLMRSVVLMTRECGDIELRMSEVIRNLSNMSSNMSMATEALDVPVLGLANGLVALRAQAAQVHAAEVRLLAAGWRARGIPCFCGAVGRFA